MQYLLKTSRRLFTTTTTGGLRLPPMPSIREILKLYNLSASKYLSQNFLLDENVLKRIVSSCGDLTDKYVVEIGSGPGSLTRPLIEANPKYVIGVEKDERFFPALQMLGQAAQGKFFLVQGDILTIKEEALLKYYNAQESNWNEESKIFFIGNLPFGIATPLLIKWLRQICYKQGPFLKYGRIPMVLMFQREVGERICAKPKTEQYGRLSVVSQNYCKVKHLFIVKGKTFIPPPKVDASVVYLEPREQPLVDVEMEKIEKFCKIVFGMRRKKLFSNLRENAGLSKEQCELVFKKLQIPLEYLEGRAEDLTVKNICLLSKEIIQTL